MTNIKFYFDNEILTGYRIKGHSTSSAYDETGKVVCSAISSAAFMAANTITEVIGAKALINVNDGEMELKVTSNLEECTTVLMGFMLHMQQLSKQYSGYIKIDTEV